MLVLDGTALSAARAPALALRGQSVATNRGYRPRLVLVAFADALGSAPYSARKVRACAAAGVDVLPLILPPDITTAIATQRLRTCLEEERYDAVFLEFPFPDQVDGNALVDLVPASYDVDIMTDEQVSAYMSGATNVPPLTVSAGLELLDAYGVNVSGKSGCIVGPDIPFNQMFSEALARRGVLMRPILAPDDEQLHHHLQQANLVVASASVAGVLLSSSLSPGTIVIDAGYFNVGGKGDVDITDGVTHLSAIAPVPGGIGPMTVSMLVDRVITLSERV